MSQSSMINNIFPMIDKDSVKVLSYCYHLTPELCLGMIENYAE